MFMRLTSELSWQRLRWSAVDFYSKTKKNRPLSHPLGHLGGNVRTPSMARWKAHGRLYIRRTVVIELFCYLLQTDRPTELWQQYRALHYMQSTIIIICSKCFSKKHIPPYRPLLTPKIRSFLGAIFPKQKKTCSRCGRTAMENFTSIGKAKSEKSVTVHTKKRKAQ